MSHAILLGSFMCPEPVLGYSNGDSCRIELTRGTTLEETAAY